MPTRERERWAKQAIQSALDTATGEVEILVGMNPDCVYDLSELPVKPFVMNGGTCKRCFEIAKHATGDLLVAFCDDFLCQTPGWDELLHKKIPEHGIACLYFNDGRGKNCQSKIPAVTRDFYAIAGFIPEYFFHWFGDQWVTDIATEAGCLFECYEVTIKHCRERWGSNEAKGMPQPDRGNKPERERWNDLASERQRLAGLLKKAISERTARGA